MSFDALHNILAKILADEDDILLQIKENGDVVLTATDLRHIYEDAGILRLVLFRNCLADDIIRHLMHGDPIQIEFCSNIRLEVQETLVEAEGGILGFQYHIGTEKRTKDDSRSKGSKNKPKVQ